MNDLDRLKQLLRAHHPCISIVTMEEAWDEFCRHCPPRKWDRQAVEKEWFRIIAELFPGKQPDELSPVEWAAMRDTGPTKVIPF